MATADVTGLDYAVYGNEVWLARLRFTPIKDHVTFEERTKLAFINRFIDEGLARDAVRRYREARTMARTKCGWRSGR